MPRRQLLRLMAAAGLVTVAGRRARGERDSAQPLYYTWPGYDVPEFYPDYVRTYGLPVTQVFLDEHEAFEALRDGLAADVVHPCNESIDHWRRNDLIRPIDVTRLSHWPDVFPSLANVPGAQVGGQQWFVPIDWGTTSIVYRTDLVDLREESYGLLWDERYAGRLVIGQDASDTLIVAGLMAGVRDPYDMDDVELRRVKDLLLRQRPLLSFYWLEAEEIETALAAGHIVASTAWPETFHKLREQGVPVAYMNPKEGMLCYCCGAVLATSATAVDRAYTLIDAMLAPAVGKWLVEEWGYPHVNRKTYDLVDPQVLADLGLPHDAEGMLARGIMARPLRRPDLYEQILDDVMSGMG